MTSPRYPGPAGEKGSPEAAQAPLQALKGAGGTQSPGLCSDPERAVDTPGEAPSRATRP